MTNPTPPTPSPITPPSGNPFADPFFAAPGGATPGQDVGTGPSSDPFPNALRPLRKSERVYSHADFFFAGGQGTIVPPLVMIAPVGATGTAAGFGAANTSPLFGNREKLKELRPGFRAGGGIWIDKNSNYGLDFTGMALSDTSDQFQQTAAVGGLVIARPVVNGLNNTNIGIPLGTTLPATIFAQVDTAYWGADANFRYNLQKMDIARFDLLVGYRYAQLGDQVWVSASQTDQVGVTVTGNTVGLTFFGGAPQLDFFRTRNQFHGGQVGIAGEVRVFDKVSIHGRGTVALGATLSDVTLGGSGAQAGGAGLLVQPTNAGSYRETYFSVMPELIGKIGYEATNRLRLNLGYSWTYWSKVARAADQIDLTVLAPGRPSYQANTTDYWVQGWSLGLDWRW
jgi:hypothetical protein